MPSDTQTSVKGMIRIPAGEFTRGSEHSPDEQPLHTIKVSAFLIDRAPVTNKDFRAFIEAGGYQNPVYWTPRGWEYIQDNQFTEPNYWRDPIWNPDEVPVTGVSWWEALAYARFVGKTLPTEAQWEYACRGTDGRTYPWGEDEPTLEYANYAPNSDPLELARKPTRPDAHPKNVSPFGCIDMAGNLAEWCLDNYHPNYSYEGADSADPLYVASEEEEHVVRGGCGLHTEDYMRCSSRDCYSPGVRDNLMGFRCVAKE